MDWKLDASKDPETSLNSILAKFERLAGQGFTLPKEQKAMTILRGILSRWDSFAGTILAMAPAAGLTVQHVCIQIQEEWRRRHAGTAHMARGDLQSRIEAPAQWQTATGRGRGGVAGGRGQGRGRGRGRGRGGFNSNPQQTAPQQQQQQQQQWPG